MGWSLPSQTEGNTTNTPYHTHNTTISVRITRPADGALNDDLYVEVFVESGMDLSDLEVPTALLWSGLIVSISRLAS